MNIKIDEAYCRGKKRYGKRGRAAIGKNPFLAAVSIGEKGDQLAIRFKPSDCIFQIGDQRLGSKHLTLKRNVVTDSLECFTPFQESGHEHIAIDTGVGTQNVEISKFR
ncbi:MAG: hypothetical protein OEL83_00045 [Desulforhopalus sp.]|nr:hypothetical protein [Desulforhopalus sp.]